MWLHTPHQSRYELIGYLFVKRCVFSGHFNSFVYGFNYSAKIISVVSFLTYKNVRPNFKKKYFVLI